MKIMNVSEKYSHSHIFTILKCKRKAGIGVSADVPKKVKYRNLSQKAHAIFSYSTVREFACATSYTPEIAMAGPDSFSVFPGNPTCPKECREN